jgi:hypothetical protein
MGKKGSNHGVGAVVSALTKFLHPSALIRENYPNPVPGHRTKNLITKSQEEKMSTENFNYVLVFAL